MSTPVKELTVGVRVVYCDTCKELQELQQTVDIYRRELARLNELPNCNDCGHTRETCLHMPRLGQDVRINCPLWIPPVEK